MIEIVVLNKCRWRGHSCVDVYTTYFILNRSSKTPSRRPEIRSANLLKIAARLLYVVLNIKCRKIIHYPEVQHPECKKLIFLSGKSSNICLMEALRHFIFSLGAPDSKEGTVHSFTLATPVHWRVWRGWRCRTGKGGEEWGGAYSGRTFLGFPWQHYFGSLARPSRLGSDVRHPIVDCGVCDVRHLASFAILASAHLASCR